MSENPLHSLFQNLEKISACVQTHLSNFVIGGFSGRSPSPSSRQTPILSVSSSSTTNAVHPIQPADILNKAHSAAPVTKEDLGRCTWTFLHTLAAQYPDNPTRQQKKDVKDLMAILSRMYPCQECADHFKDVLRVNPVQAGSHAELSQWLCHVHNVVNRSLGKSVFRCERVDARWGKLECEHRACDVQGALTKFD